MMYIAAMITDMRGMPESANISKPCYANVLERYEGFVTKAHLENLERVMDRKSIEGTVKRVFLPFKVRSDRQNNKNIYAQRVLLKDTVNGFEKDRSSYDKKDTEHLVMFFGPVRTLDKIMLGDFIRLEWVGHDKKNNEYYADMFTRIIIKERAEVIPLSRLRTASKQIQDKCGSVEKPLITIGRVVEIYPSYFYMYGNTEKRMEVFKIMDKNASINVVVWESPINIKNLKEGDIVRIENGVLHNGEIHINLISRIIIVKRDKHD